MSTCLRGLSKFTLSLDKIESITDKHELSGNYIYTISLYKLGLLEYPSDIELASALSEEFRTANPDISSIYSINGELYIINDKLFSLHTQGGFWVDPFKYMIIYSKLQILDMITNHCDNLFSFDEVSKDDAIAKINESEYEYFIFDR